MNPDTGTGMQAGTNEIRNALGGHRDFLFRYALMHVRDRDQADDLVQETLLSACESAGRFRRESALRTWLVSILRNKIVDQARRAARNPAAPAAHDLADHTGEAAFFDARGHWGSDAPRPWRDPGGALEDARFWEAFEACCDHLPAKTARVFLMREVMGCSIEEICGELGISATNCSVILYRARLRLRQCLEQNWFASADT